MKPKVSIIVPIYNVEKYLSRCLDSLISQSLKEIEIIAVNDGSTDSSFEILKEYARNNTIIKVVNKSNGGVSSARNKGLQFASGEYIGFVDPDDWVNQDMYETLYNTAIQDKADIVMCSYIREFVNHSKVKNFNVSKKVSYFNNDIRQNIMRRLIGPLNEEVADLEMLDAWGTVWSKIYRADLIKNNLLSFTDLSMIGTNEDTLFNIQACYYAKSFIFINAPFYHYWKENNGSVTSGYKPYLLEQWSILYKIIEDFLNNNGLDENFHTALNNRKCLNLLGLGLNTISRDNKSSFFKKIKTINGFLNDHRIMRSFKQMELSNFPVVWRAFYLIAKLRVSFVFYFMLVSIDVLRRTLR